MSAQPLSTVGLVMPDDFPTATYEAIQARVSSRTGVEPALAAHYQGAWRAVAYRFLACADHDKAYTASSRRAGANPSQPERYIQERELFSFFMSGLSTIESFCLGLFAIGSMLKADMFLMTKPGHLKQIDLKKTPEQFATALPREAITAALQDVNNMPQFEEWNTIRNILTHRSAPPRIIYGWVGSPPPEGDRVDWLHDIRLDENTTASRRAWLAAILHTLMKAAEGFTGTRL
jgi:hypothetical protein